MRRRPEDPTSDIAFGGWLGDAVGVTFQARRVGRRHMRCIVMGLAFVLTAVAIAVLGLGFYLVMLGLRQPDL